MASAELVIASYAAFWMYSGGLQSMKPWPVTGQRQLGFTETSDDSALLEMLT